MKKSLFVRLSTRLRKYRLYFSFLSLIGEPLLQNKWVIIIGCYNSGTTLLHSILAKHPEISAMSDEGVMLTNLLPRPEDYGWRRMWHKCEELMRINEKNEVRVAKSIKKTWSHFLDINKPYLLEKSISNTPRMGFFEKNFNSPYFIHIVRNGYAAIEGIYRKTSSLDASGNPIRMYTIEDCAQQWKRSIDVIEKEKNNVKYFYELTYEDLTKDPDEVMNGIYDYLNLSRINNNFQKMNFKIHEKYSEIKNMNESSLRRLSKVDITKIDSVCGNLLNKYNYN